MSRSLLRARRLRGVCGLQGLALLSSLFVVGTLLAPSAALAQGGAFGLAITVSDGINSLELEVGADAAATDAFDPGIDILAPPPPPAGALDARIVGNDFDYLRDVRSVGHDQEVYAIRYSPSSTGDPIVLSWDPSALVAGLTYTFVDQLSNPDVSVDLASASSLDTGTYTDADDPDCVPFGNPNACIRSIAFLLVEAEVIPVELTSFDAVRDGDAVTLVWATASETNNSGFEVEARGPQSDAFEAVGFVEGAGTTSAPHDYRFRVAELAPGTHAFRLRQVDFDGQFELFPEVEVTIDVPGSHWISDVYPNPVVQEARLNLMVARSGSVRAVVYDLLGRARQTVFDGHAEANTRIDLRVDGRKLPAGVYVLHIEGEHVQETRTLTLLDR